MRLGNYVQKLIMLCCAASLHIACITVVRPSMCSAHLHWGSSRLWIYCLQNRRNKPEWCTSDDVWRMQCTCQGCAKDIMAAGALCPMCRASIRRTITAKFE